MNISMSGPRDNNAFRSRIAQGHTSKASLITYEGILNEYSYGIGEEFDHLFNTTYSFAITKSPDDGKYEHYLCLEMKSKLDGDGLARNGGRPSMNFCFVLDISGSMDCSFNNGDGKSKLEVAKECLINLLSKLQPNDKFGLILFNDKASTLVPLSVVKDANMGNIKGEILKVKTDGGTRIHAGMTAAEAMLLNDKDHVISANRIFFLTDMNPQDEVDLVQVGHGFAEKGVYISLIGLGVDFNSDLAYKFANVKGCNSFSVSSASEFRKQMNEDFDYTSYLICYDVSLKMRSSEFDVEEIYGSPTEPDKSIGEVLKLDSICPSPKSSEGGIKGGIVVLKLKRKNEDKTCGDNLHLELTYKDWQNNDLKQESTFRIPDDPNQDDFQNSSAKKAVALVRYVKLLKAVLTKPELAESNTKKLNEFKSYLVKEIETLNDKSMEKEVLMLDNILNEIGKKANGGTEIKQ